MKLIWLTDTHFASGDERVVGYDPRARIAAAVEHVNAQHADADYCVISGDLVERGEVGEYRAFKEWTDRFAMPVLPLVGNHDHRDSLREVYSLHEAVQDGFIQYSLAGKEAVLLFLDTIKEGESPGYYCAERFDWLRSTLDAFAGMPAYLFLHHPPMTLHLPMQDTEGMENGAEFLDFLAGYPSVRHLFIGHVHRPISGRVGSVSFSTMRSALYQAPPPRPDWDWDSFRPSPEAPMLGVIHIGAQGVVMQYEQFCDHEIGAPEP